MQLWKQGAHVVDGGDDVGARLAEDDQQDRTSAVGDTCVADVLDGILHVADVAEPHDTVLIRGHDQRTILICFQKLIVGINGPGVNCSGKFAFRLIGVGGR